MITMEDLESIYLEAWTDVKKWYLDWSEQFMKEVAEREQRIAGEDVSDVKRNP